MELAPRIELGTPSLPRKYSTSEPCEQNSRENGAGEEARTLDFHLGRVALYQLSYARAEQKKWWRGIDSNNRRLTPADLQSAPFGHSGTTPKNLIYRNIRSNGPIDEKWSCSQESNLRPTVYKTVALPTELEQPIHRRQIDESEIYNGMAEQFQANLVTDQNIFPWQWRQPRQHSAI